MAKQYNITPRGKFRTKLLLRCFWKLYLKDEETGTKVWWRMERNTMNVSMRVTGKYLWSVTDYFHNSSYYSDRKSKSQELKMIFVTDRRLLNNTNLANDTITVSKGIVEIATAECFELHADKGDDSHDLTIIMKETVDSGRGTTIRQTNVDLGVPLELFQFLAEAAVATAELIKHKHEEIIANRRQVLSYLNKVSPIALARSLPLSETYVK